MKLFLHIGWPKTGTTSLQEHLSKFHGDPDGELWYPPVGLSGGDPSHSFLSHTLSGRDDWGLLDALEVADAAQGAVFLSDENVFVEFPGATPALRSRFGELLGGVEVTVVSVGRAAAAWQRSFYLQAVQLGRSAFSPGYATANSLWSTSDRFADFWKRPYAAQLLDGATLEDEIAELVGAARIIRLRYESGGDIVAAMRAALALPPVDAAAPIRRNESLSDVQGEILRQANGFSTEDARNVRMLIARRNGWPTRRRRMQRIPDWAAKFDWTRLRYVPNPPLVYDAANFEAEVAALRDIATRASR
ncbi:MAG: hypothetical protein AAFW69_01085 [Pseudomonadota bacterium]